LPKFRAKKGSNQKRSTLTKKTKVKVPKRAKIKLANFVTLAKETFTMAHDTKSTPKLPSRYGLLCLIGQKVQALKLLEPLHQKVKIKQKTVQYRPNQLA
jgi:hypothetical protein